MKTHMMSTARPVSITSHDKIENARAFKCFVFIKKWIIQNTIDLQKEQNNCIDVFQLYILFRFDLIVN